MEQKNAQIQASSESTGFGEVDEMDALTSEAIDDQAGSAPVVRLLDLIIKEALKEGASDIHLEPTISPAGREGYRLRFRVEGEMVVKREFPEVLGRALLARLKVAARVNHTKTKISQEGSIRYSFEERSIRLRAAFMPTNGDGERATLRVLGNHKVLLDLDSIGLTGDARDHVRQALCMPNGLIIVSGPVSSGKTTTLYTLLSVLNEPHLNIISLEEPVERVIPGVSQVETGPNRPMSEVVREISVQDPDVLMLGEMGSEAVVKEAIRMAMSGTLVLGSHHAFDAASAAKRAHLASGNSSDLVRTLRLVISQRLVRKICVHCREEANYDSVYMDRVGLSEVDAARMHFSRGRGCDQCSKTGYLGKTAIFEVMPISPDLEGAMEHNKSAAMFRLLAVQNSGMKTLRQSGIDLAAKGITTLEEVIKFTPGNY